MRWLRRILPERVAYRVLFVPLWIAILAAESLRPVLVRRKMNRLPLLSCVRQYGRVLGLCLRNPGMLPEEYYTYDIDEANDESLLAQFAHNDEVMVAMLIQGRQKRLTPDRRQYKSLDDKVEFHRLCRRESLPVAPIVACFTQGRMEWMDGAGSLPRMDLFSKPVYGFQGMGASRIFFSQEGRYVLERPRTTPDVIGIHVDYPPEPLLAEELIEVLCRMSTPMSMILQPRLATHKELTPLVGTTTLASLRVITVLERTGAPSVLFAVLRSAREDSAVDNISSGGIAAEIDLGTGELTGKAWTRSGRRGIVEGFMGHEWLHHHPATGTKLSGYPVPCAKEILSLCPIVHRAVAEAEEYVVPLVGWDVGVTDQGPVFLEGDIGANLEYQGFGPNPFWSDAVFRRAILSYLEPLAGARLSLRQLSKSLPKVLRGEVEIYREPLPKRLD